MNRRRFLQLLTTAAAAVAVSSYWTPTPELLEPPAPLPVYSGVPQRLAFDPKAFSSLHVIRSFEFKTRITRLDVLFGVSAVGNDGWTRGVVNLKAGDRITISGVNV